MPWTRRWARASRLMANRIHRKRRRRRYPDSTRVRVSNAIAAALLGEVERLIGRGNQACGVDVGRRAGNAMLTVMSRCAKDAAATVLRSRSASIPAASAPVAGRMTANSSPPQRAMKSLGRCSRAASGRHSGARRRRPGGRRIVVVLELVDVYEQQRQRRPIAAVAVKFLRQTLIKGDAVAKAAELVGEALLLQAEIGLLKLAW